MIDLVNPVTRQLDLYRIKGKPMQTRMTPEGIYLKVKGQRWATAVLLPWGAAYTRACFLKAAQVAAEKKARREARRR